MKKSTTIRLLISPENTGAIDGILAILRKKGLHFSASDAPLKKTDTVLAVLSEQFYADQPLRTRLLDHLATGSRNVLLLRLDDVPIPSEINNALYSRNIVSAPGKEDAQLAQRLYTSLPDVRNLLPLILAASAAVLVILCGMFIWRSIAPEGSLSAASDTAQIPDAFGITQADLEAIRNVIIIGDHFSYYTAADLKPTKPGPNPDSIATESWEEDTKHWYSTEDGHEYTLTHYDDLKFLEYMPNLQYLDMILVDVDADSLPNLQSAKNLISVNIQSSTVDNLNWLGGSNVKRITLYKTNVTDYSPLTACPYLNHLNIDFAYQRDADFSGFAPASLRSLYLYNLDTAAAPDFSGLSACTFLQEVSLCDLPITDLSFLSENPSLQYLELRDLHNLTDISAVSRLKGLKEVHIECCNKLKDHSPISSCTALEQYFLSSDQAAPLDAAFLGELPRLMNIGIHGFSMDNMDFLKSLPTKSISLSFSGNIRDYSALAAIHRFFFLHANTVGSDFSEIEPYLRDKYIDHLELYECNNLDLSALPSVTSELHLIKCSLKDLSGMPPLFLKRLYLQEMQQLTSLKGLEAITTLSLQRLDLNIVACPRLADYSALQGAHLATLGLTGVYTLPDFSQFNTNKLHLEHIAELKNLQCLEGMDGSIEHSFELVDLNELQDIRHLRSLPGTNLSVPPQMAEQAEDLVDEGIFKYYDIIYPDGSWNPLDTTFSLLSLDELQTLPGAALRRITEVSIAGDQIYDPQYWYVQERWQKDKMTVVLHNWKTGEEKEVNPGTIEDLHIFSELTGLRFLRLHCQPIRSLDGIQNFTQLQRLEATYCFDLEDASAVFALQDIQQILLQDSRIDSIQGVQNLLQLQELNLGNTQVTDLTPLNGCDYSFADREGGFELGINDIPCQDFSPLAAIPRFRNLHIHGQDTAMWEPYTRDAEIYWLGCNISDSDIFPQLASRHPELTELHIAGSPGVTDLTPLLSHEDLRYVKISRDMTHAVDSLEGQKYSFQLDIDG